MSPSGTNLTLGATSAFPSSSAIASVVASSTKLCFPVGASRSWACAGTAVMPMHSTAKMRSR